MLGQLTTPLLSKTHKTMWKQGQIVTVRGIVCRVTKTTRGRCWDCEFGQLPCSEYPCSTCCMIGIEEKFPSNCCLKRYEPRRSCKNT